MRLIDADELIKRVSEHPTFDVIERRYIARFINDNALTTDREEVRCIECEFCEGKEYPYTYCNLIKLHVPEDGYCHMGVWKEGVKNETY